MDVWKHGKYFDTWSIVHFLSGFLLAGIFYRIGYEFMRALLFSALILLAWEVFEWVIKIIEPSTNVVADIVIGLAGFFAGAYIYYEMNRSFELYHFTPLALVVILSLWGFMDFLKRGYR